jgi:hypothetical protein
VATGLRWRKEWRRIAGLAQLRAATTPLHAKDVVTTNQLAGGHSGLAEVPYRCATAPEFHRTFPSLAAGHDDRPREQLIEMRA